MREIKDIAEIHQLVLDIAKAFHKVCVDNYIPYYMLFGTMLGAVRHKGFIPWDDDMDFGVEYKYYQQLLKALKNELPERYRCLTRDDCQGAVGGYLKIEDTRTIVHEPSRINEEENSGLFIDVFIIYPCHNDKSFFSRSGMIKLCTLIQAYRFYSKRTPLWQNCISKVVKFFFFWLKKPTMINIFEKYFVPKEGCWRTTNSSVYNFKDIIRKDVYGNPQLVPFEDTMFYGIEESDCYLKHIYGNYMQLPPKNKRQTHISGVFYQCVNN